MNCRGRARPALVMLTALAVVVAGSLLGNHLLAAQFPPTGALAAPPLPQGLEWLNTDRPLQLAELRGKFVLLDFWTYCCINCMHILPELKQLEHDYSRQLVVIGVHSAKFATEKERKNIAEAIDRYEIEHPVAVDSQLHVWRLYGVRAWPSLVLIDPRGAIIWRHSGEITARQVAKVLDQAIPRYRRAGILNERQPAAATRRPVATPLRFPGKVLADPSGKRLFIADSNHNRIVVARLDGTLVAIIGSGRMGRANGKYHAAEFNKPQGMALVNETLYLADTENHLIRKIDLRLGEVSTVAGAGSPNQQFPRHFRPSPPSRTALSSPWALWPHEKHLFIAMAGSHQIWRMDLSGKSIGPYAGNGREDIVDGRLLPKEPFALGYSSFAQPSGLASDGTWLFVADSEGSSIRMVPLGGKGEVKTLVGTSDLANARLFTFGDADGPAARALLQHPLGMVFHRGQLYVADTYNNKVKRINPETGDVETIAGDGSPGQFNEPAGITATDGKLYVADTNNHRLQVVDLDRANAVSTLSVAKLTPPAK